MYATKCTPYTHLCGWFHRIAKIRAVQLGHPPSPPQHSDAGRKLFQGVVHWSRRKCNLASRQTHWHPLEPGTCRWGSWVSSFRQLKRVFHILYNGKFTKLMHSLWYGQGRRQQPKSGEAWLIFMSLDCTHVPNFGTCWLTRLCRGNVNSCRSLPRHQFARVCIPCGPNA